MKINYYKAILAGVVGTLLFDLVGLLFTGSWWDIPAVLAQAVGLPAPVAVLMHYGNGIALAAIYAALAPSLLGPSWFRAVSFATIETLVLVWFLLFPLLDLGIAVLGGGLLLTVLSMVRHWAYAIPLAYFFRVKNDPTDPEDKRVIDTVFDGVGTGIEECQSSSSFFAYDPTDWSAGSFLHRF